MKRSVTVAIALVIVVLVVGGALYYATRPTTREIKLQAFDFFFLQPGTTGNNPTITVTAGDTIVLTIENLGSKDHEFFVLTQEDYKKYFDAIQAGQTAEEPEPAFKGAEVEDVKPREAKTATFIAERPGTFVYACLDKDGTRPLTHAHKGMFGTFEVRSSGLFGMMDWLSNVPSFFALQAPVIGAVSLVSAFTRQNTHTPHHVNFHSPHFL